MHVIADDDADADEDRISVFHNEILSEQAIYCSNTVQALLTNQADIYFLTTFNLSLI